MQEAICLNPRTQSWIQSSHGKTDGRLWRVILSRPANRRNERRELTVWLRSMGSISPAPHGRKRE